MEGYLLDLKQRMKSATKDGETMSFADAEWNLTALENFSFCDGSKSSINMIIDTFYTRIKVTGENISLFDLNLAYENNKKQISKRFNSLTENDKNIYYIKCILSNTIRNDSIEFITVTNMRDGGEAPNLMQFGPTDYWYDFDGLGKCGAYEGQCIGRDAVTEIKSKVIANIPQYDCPDNGRIYFTNIVEDYFDSYYYYDTCEYSPYPPYCLYVNETYFYNCLSPDELTWYLNKIIEYITNYEDTHNKSLIDFDIYGADFDGIDNKNKPVFWVLKMNYATIHCTQQGNDL